MCNSSDECDNVQEDDSEDEPVIVVTRSIPMRMVKNTKMANKGFAKHSVLLSVSLIILFTSEF